MGATVALALVGNSVEAENSRSRPWTLLQNQTFNNRNSRSHELITRKKVSYSLRLTET